MSIARHWCFLVQKMFWCHPTEHCWRNNTLSAFILEHARHRGSRDKLVRPHSGWPVPYAAIKLFWVPLVWAINEFFFTPCVSFERGLATVLKLGAAASCRARIQPSHWHCSIMYKQKINPFLLFRLRIWFLLTKWMMRSKKSEQVEVAPTGRDERCLLLFLLVFCIVISLPPHRDPCQSTSGIAEYLGFKRVF